MLHRAAHLASWILLLGTIAWASPHSVPGTTSSSGSFLEYTLSYGEADLSASQRKIEDRSYDLMRLTKAELWQQKGDPIVPVRYLRFALPVGCTADEVRLGATGEVSFTSIRLVPSAGAVDLAGSPPGPCTESGVYEQDAFFPGKLGELAGVTSIAGYPVATVAVYPLQFNPVQRKAVLHKNFSITLRVTRNENHLPVYSRSAEVERMHRERIVRLVDNPDDVPSTVVEAPATAGGSGSSRSGRSQQWLIGTVHHLIITDDTLAPAWQRLADWKSKKGIPSEVVTFNWIDANYQGLSSTPDFQDKMRHCIRDYYQYKGLVYVLIASDAQQAGRYAYRESYTTADQAPCDFYFSDLDGTWNADGDPRWGEYPQDNIVFGSEVFVGRASCDNLTEADTFIDKVLHYEGEGTLGPLDTNYLNTFFLGSWSLDDLVTHYNTITDIIIGLAPAHLAITALYEIPYYTLTLTSLLNELNSCRNLVNFGAIEGNFNFITMHDPGSSNFTEWHARNSVTNKPNFTGSLYSVSNHGANFNSGYNRECVGEAWTNSPNGGGFWIGHTATAWSWLGFPRGHYGAAINEYYYEELFLNNTRNLGQIMCDARDRRIAAAQGDDWERSIHYSLVLLGDPETPLYLTQAPSLAMSHTNSLFGWQPFTVNVTSGGSPVSGAKVCIWNPDDANLHWFDTTDASGNVTFQVDPLLRGTVYITATKIDHVPAQGTVNAYPSSESLVADVDTVKAGTVGIVNFALNALPAQGNDTFGMLGSITGTAPGITLPGGLVLPLTWDSWTTYIMNNSPSAMFYNFVGTFNATGLAFAQFNSLIPIAPTHVGRTLYFAYCTTNPYDFVSIPVEVDVIP